VTGAPTQMGRERDSWGEYPVLPRLQWDGQQAGGPTYGMNVVNGMNGMHGAPVTNGIHSPNGMNGQQAADVDDDRRPRL